MAAPLRNIVFLILLMLSSLAGIGQQGFYVPKGGKIFFNGDTATIFSNVNNKGKLGVGKKAVVNFKGKIWENDLDALITDESNQGDGATGIGGKIRFMGDSGIQQIDGGYNAASRQGAAFYHLDIMNQNGVELMGSTTRIRNQLKFSQGLFYLQGNILSLGDGNPGIISNYDSSKYIVTGGGYLLRENISRSDNWVTFPIGTAAQSYTPLAVRNKTAQDDDYYAGVSDGVKSNVLTGDDLSAKSVNKTWQIGKLKHPDQGETDVTLQHLVKDEGAQFAVNRQHAYVSRYDGSKWDTGIPQHTPLPGTLTTGMPFMINSGINTRYFKGTISASSFFTKLTGFGDTTVYKTKLWFSAYRVDYLKVKPYWSTRPEVNIKYFIVQRRLSNESTFTNRGDTVFSKANNRFSKDFLHYETIDPNQYQGISYYRLMMVDYDGNITYSNIVPIGYKPGNNLLIWPNPAPSTFFVGISNVSAIKTIVIWDVIGQVIRKEEVNDRAIIEMRLYTKGTYLVGFVSYSGQIIETRKLVILGY